jgi:ABC-type dipeptide/oligopeptide/nickel transport system permease subunit
LIEFARCEPLDPKNGASNFGSPPRWIVSGGPPEKVSRGGVPKNSPLTGIRLGLIALALSWLLFTLGILRGEIDMADPESFIRAASSAAYLPWTIIRVGIVLNLFGTFAPYRYLTYQGESMIAFLLLS